MAGTITGRVVGCDGVPMSGVAVAIAQSDQPHRDIAALTLADGSFRLNGLRPGNYVLEAHGDGLVGSVFVTLTVEGASVVEIALA